MILPAMLAAALRTVHADSMHADSAMVCARDARRDVPLSGVQAVDAAGHVMRFTASCARVATGGWTLRKIGYHAQRISVPAADSVLLVRLYALADGPVLLATSEVRAQGDDAALARTTAFIDADSARSMGVSTIEGLVGALPFASLRGARGDVGLSLRGARREGVVVTLDGMSLNDASTGTADVSDVPMILLGSAGLSLGADPIGAGPGASGGVLALNSAGRTLLSASAGSFGARALEGAYEGNWRSASVASSASYRSSENDFDFVNDASDATLRERRINNDERRGALTLAASNERAHGLLLLSTSDRGMVGPVNVRTYDADRARTVRAAVRAQSSIGGAALSGGARAFTLRYRDPSRPELNSDARTIASDVDLGGSLHEFEWRAGAGFDGLTATGNLRQSRGRGFLAASRAVSLRATRVGLGARLDAVGAFGALPSFSLAARHGFGREAQRALAVGVRIAQAVRAPTLYDLYFSSPQRLFVRTLRPERVSLDAEVNANGSLPTAVGVLDGAVALVTRDTRDAIVWFPGNFGFTPQNAGSEKLRGIEARAGLAPAWGNLSAWLTSYDASLRVGGLSIPTPYVARIAGGGQVAVRARGFTTSAIVRANGARPYTAGRRNRDFELPPVTLVDLALSRAFTVGTVRALTAISLDNLTDVSWQQVRGFPLPGRSWAVSITFSPSSLQ